LSKVYHLPIRHEFKARYSLLPHLLPVPIRQEFKARYSLLHHSFAAACLEEVLVAAVQSSTV